MEGKSLKALSAIDNALEHISTMLDFDHLECVHIDQMLSRIIDLPTEPKRKNSRRNLILIRQWMLEDGAAVALLEVLGQVYWRLGDLNEIQFREAKETLYQRQSYVNLVQNPRATTLVLRRIKSIQESKFRICDELVEEFKASEIKFESHRRQRFNKYSSQELDCFAPETSYTSIYGLLTPQLEDSIEMSLGAIKSQNLWRNDLEQLLIDFYISGFCPGRTLLDTSNMYLNIAQLAKQNESTRLAILSLSASYMKHFQESDAAKYHEADHFYMSEALQALMQEITEFGSTEACLATGMLLVHHAIINDVETGASWSCHLKMLDIFTDRSIFVKSDAAVFIGYYLILAQTVQCTDDIRAGQHRSMEWLTDGTVEEITEISGTTGLSRQVLFAIASITSLKETPNERHAEKLQAFLQADVKQWTTDATGGALQVVLDTAETYRLAAQIYLQCRIFGLTSFHPTVIELCNQLYSTLLKLPISGPLCTALYPIWPFFMASVIGSPTMRDLLFKRFLILKKLEKGRSNSVLKTILLAQDWIDRQSSKAHRRADWWEEMMASVREFGTELCFG